MLVGATATGKSAVAQWLAERCGAAVLSADAMLVYRGMDIGTAKPPPEARGKVPYLGMDIVTPGLPCSAGEWLAAVRRDLARLAPPRPLIVAGGTGLYVQALLGGLDAPPADPLRRRHWEEVLARGGVAALRQALGGSGGMDALPPGDRDNPRRLIRALERAEAGAVATSWRERRWPVVAGLRIGRRRLHQRIGERAARMFADGLAAEAAALRNRLPDGFSATAARAIGYAEALALHDGEIGLDEAVARTAARTRRLARRQETWFRHRLPVRWIDVAGDEPAGQVARRVLQAWREHGPATIHP